jgi:hypothetical protein
VRAKVWLAKHAGEGQEDNHVGATSLFASLDNDSSITGDDICREAKEALRLTLQQGGTGWKLLAYLENLKKLGDFDFRIAYDAKTNAPTGAIWMTGRMMKDFIRFGDILSLDTMMRDYNKLGWKFIGPCGFDASNKLCSSAECICLEESLDRYEWIVHAMLDMVPAVDKTHIKLIFGDGIMSEQLLIQLGIKETCRIFWDHYHLNKAWKEYFSDRVFTELEPNLKFLSQPHLFAAYEIDSVPGLLGKRGSSISESQHGSIVAHVGKARRWIQKSMCWRFSVAKTY